MTAPVDRVYIEILPQFKAMNEQLKRGVDDALKGVKTQLTGVTNDVHKAVEQSSGRVLTRVAAVGTAVGNLASQGITSLIGMGKSAITAGLQTAAGMEQAQIAFGTLLHSTTEAKSFLSDLKEFAAKTPFELPGLVDASRQLLGVGAQAKDVIPTLTAYGDAAGALGIQQDGFNRIMLATTQAMSAGTLHAGDLLQMTEAGLPVWKLLSEALGKPVSELKKLSEQGKLMSKDVLPKLQAQMEKDYGGAMSKQSQTLSGLWSTMMDTFHQGLADTLLPMEPLLRNLIPKAADVMGKGLKAAGGAASQFFSGLSGNVKIMAQNDRPKLELFGLGVRGLFDSFKSGKSSGDGFIGFMQRIGVSLKEGVKWVKDMAHNLSGPLHDTFSAVASIVKAFLPDIINLGKNFAQVSVELFQKLAPGLKAVAGFLADHKKIVEQVAVALGVLVAITKAHQAVLALEAAGGLLQWIKQTKLVLAATKAWTAVQWLLNIAMDANPIGLVVLAIAALVAAFVYAWQHSEKFRNFIKKLGESLKNAGIEIGHFFVAIWNGAKKLSAWLDDIPNKIKNMLVGAKDWLVHMGLLMIQGLLRGATNAWHAVTAWVGKWLLLIGTAIGDANKWMRDKATQFIQNFLLGLRIIWHIVTEWFGKMLTRISDAIGNANLWMKNKAVAFINNFLLGLRIIWHVVTDWFHQMLTRIGTAIGNANGWMRNKATEFIRNFLTGLQVIWHIVTDWFHQMLNRIGGAIGNARNWASNLGASIVNGLLSGVQSVWHTITDWFGKIPGWIKSALGIKSPPAWAIDAGSWIMKGLLKGLIGGSFTLTGFLKHYTQLARDKLASFFGGSHGSVGAGGLHQDILNLLDAVRKQFGNVPLLSGLRPGAHTLSGNLSRHAVGEAIDIPPSYSVARWLSETFGRGLRELITPWNEWNIYHGRHHVYTGDVFAQHAGTGRFKGNAHIHAAYATGAWKIPHDQLAYLHAREMVVPAGPADAIRASARTYNASSDAVTLLQQQTALLARLVNVLTTPVTPMTRRRGLDAMLDAYNQLVLERKIRP